MAASPIDTFASLFSGRAFDVAALLKANDISQGVQSHLQRVYMTLALGIVSSALGVWFALSFDFFLPVWASIIGMIALSMWLPQTRHDGSSPEKRLAIFSAITFFKGMSLSHLVAVILDFDASILLSALVYTASTFAVFSAFALVSKRRSQLYLGAICGSALSWLALGSLVNLFWPSSLFFNAQLYIGLFVFVGYIIVDTQMVVEKASSLGPTNADHLMDALHLYTSLVALFVRIAIILMKNQQKRSNNDRRNDKRR